MVGYPYCRTLVGLVARVKEASHFAFLLLIFVTVILEIRSDNDRYKYQVYVLAFFIFSMIAQATSQNDPKQLYWVRKKYSKVCTTLAANPKAVAYEIVFFMIFVVMIMVFCYITSCSSAPGSWCFIFTKPLAFRLFHYRLVAVPVCSVHLIVCRSTSLFNQILDDLVAVLHSVGMNALLVWRLAGPLDRN